MRGDFCFCAGFCWLSSLTLFVLLCTNAAASDFRFDRDTFAFANQTVFEYHEGHPSLLRPSTVIRDAYNRHSFVLCSSASQFMMLACFYRHSAMFDYSYYVPPSQHQSLGFGL